MASFLEKTGSVPESPIFERSDCDDNPTQSYDDEVVASSPTTYMSTPPRKKPILRMRSDRTLSSGKKKVTFSPSFSPLNLTQACSPAFYDRKSIIANEDMADMTFFLERSQDSPLLALDTTSLSGTTFEIRKLVEKLTLSPAIGCCSSTELNKLGLQSTPKYGSPGRRGCGIGPKNQRQYLGTPL